MSRRGFWLIAVAVVVLAQWTKHLVQQHLPLGGSATLIPGLLWAHHLQNAGAAFGKLQGAGSALIVAAAAAVIFIIGYRAQLLRRFTELPALLLFGLALPLGGALGNMIDRVRLSQVVDFIDLGWFPVFNVADSAITLGAAALITYFLILSHSEAEDPEERRSERDELSPVTGAD